MLLLTLDSHEWTLAQQAVLTFDSMHAFVDIASEHHHQTRWLTMPLSSHAGLKYQRGLTIVSWCLEPYKQNRLSFSWENTSQKMFIGTDEIGEIVNDSDSDGGSFSELSDSDTCKVNSPFSSSSSSSEEGEVFQPEPDRGTKRICRALPKRTSTDSELGWKEQI